MKSYPTGNFWNRSLEIDLSRKTEGKATALRPSIFVLRRLPFASRADISSQRTIITKEKPNFFHMLVIIVLAFFDIILYNVKRYYYPAKGFRRTNHEAGKYR